MGIVSWAFPIHYTYIHFSIIGVKRCVVISLLFLLIDSGDIMLVQYVWQVPKLVLIFFFGSGMHFFFFFSLRISDLFCCGLIIVSTLSSFSRLRRLTKDQRRQNNRGV